MQPSRIICKNCWSLAPRPYDIITDDESEFDQMLERIRTMNVECPYCGAHGKWMRKVASKL